MSDASFIPGVRDFYLLLVLPIAAYWLSASVFHLFDCQGWFQAYKIHTYEDGQKRNRATLRQVFCQVLAQQAIQILFTLVVDRALTSSTDAGQPALNKLQLIMSENTTWTQVRANRSPTDDEFQRSSVMTTPSSLHTSMGLVLQVACAIVIADFWQYAWHRIFHSNKFLYSELQSSLTCIVGTAAHQLDRTRSFCAPPTLRALFLWRAVQQLGRSIHRRHDRDHSHLLPQRPLHLAGYVVRQLVHHQISKRSQRLPFPIQPLQLPIQQHDRLPRCPSPELGNEIQLFAGLSYYLGAYLSWPYCRNGQQAYRLT